MAMKVYQSQVGITPKGTAARINPNALSVSGAAAADFANTAGNVVADLASRQKEADDNAWISKVTAEGTKTWAERLQEAKRAAGEGADGFAPQIQSGFTAWREEVLKGAPSPEAARDAAQRFDRLGVSLYGEALDFEASAKRAQRMTDFDAGVNDLAHAAFTNPEQLDVLLAQADGDLQAAGATWMLPQDVSAKRGAIQGTLAEAALRGRIQNEPETVLAALEGDGDPMVEKLPDGRRTVLASAARAELNRRAIAHRRAKTALDNRLDDLGGVIDAGYDPGEGNFAKLETEIRRFGDDELIARAEALKGRLAFQTEIRTWTPAMLQSWINTERPKLAKGGVSPVQADRMNLAEKVLTSMRTGLERDPLSWAVEAGVAEVQPLDLGGENAAESLRARRDTALGLAEHYGVAPRFLTDEEEAQLKSRLAGASADEQVALAYSLNEGFGRHAADVFQRLAGDDPLFAHAGGLASLGPAQAATARDMLAGREAMAAGNKVLPAAVDRRSWTDDAMGGAFSETPKTRAAILAAAEAIYTVRALRQGLTADEADEDLWVESLDMAAGAAVGADGRARGGIGTWNDYAVALPTGATQDEFERLLDGVEDGDLAQLGAPVHGDGQDLTAEDLQDARLIDYGHGQYLVDMSGTGAELALGDGPNGYFVLDVRELARVVSARVGGGAETAAGEGE